MQSENRSRKIKSADKITTDKKEIKKTKEIKIKTKETEIKTKIIEISTEIDARTNATAATTIAITTANKKRLLRLCKQFVCIYISFVLKTVLILLSYLLLFNNL